jgi:hypothetical protein
MGMRWRRPKATGNGARCGVRGIMKSRLDCVRLIRT